MTLGQYGELHGLGAYHQEKKISLDSGRGSKGRFDWKATIKCSSFPESTKTWRGRETCEQEQYLLTGGD